MRWYWTRNGNRPVGWQRSEGRLRFRCSGRLSVPRSAWWPNSPEQSKPSASSPRHLYRWTERIPGGIRQNGGLQTGIMDATAARFNVALVPACSFCFCVCVCVFVFVFTDSPRLHRFCRDFGAGNMNPPGMETCLRCGARRGPRLPCPRPRERRQHTSAEKRSKIRPTCSSCNCSSSIAFPPAGREPRAGWLRPLRARP